MTWDDLCSMPIADAWRKCLNNWEEGNLKSYERKDQTIFPPSRAKMLNQNPLAADLSPILALDVVCFFQVNV